VNDYTTQYRTVGCVGGTVGRSDRQMAGGEEGKKERGGATSDRGSGFYLSIKHRATHRLLRSNSSRVMTQLLSHSLDIATREHASQSRRTSNGIGRPNSRRYPKEPSAGASNNGRTDVSRVYFCVYARVRKRLPLKVLA
jgi:hypothetical protein